MTTRGLDEFAGWVESLMRERGYDIDSPRGGGKSRIADEAGVHRAAVTRLLQRQSMPDLETMRRIAPLLGVSVRDMLIRSGRVTPEELPIAADLLPPNDWQPTMEDFARWLGVPDERLGVFIKVVNQFLEPDDEGAQGGTESGDAPDARRAARD
ncbi:helix-turn-helix domain-containing protein [Streptomyces sp. NPDC056527]|uniref:helix-turn-helix domain-containing protein n=1 Tax=Streptomyces sp. NPDC056527 TaxID=3345853 RepID=UPI00368536F8